jgi:hypothetical protein
MSRGEDFVGLPARYGIGGNDGVLQFRGECIAS